MSKIDFDPNANQKTRSAKLDTYDWATFAPDRSTKGKFTVHARRGYALNAVHAALDMNADVVLYRWQEGKPVIEGDISSPGQWVEHSRFEDFKKPNHCENCHTDLMKTYGGGLGGRGVTYNRGNNVWINTSTDPKLITVCDDCSRFHHRHRRLP